MGEERRSGERKGIESKERSSDGKKKRWKGEKRRK